jgi:hypothetical protein
MLGFYIYIILINNYFKKVYLAVWQSLRSIV